MIDNIIKKYGFEITEQYGCTYNLIKNSINYTIYRCDNILINDIALVQIFENILDEIPNIFIDCTSLRKINLFTEKIKILNYTEKYSLFCDGTKIRLFYDVVYDGNIRINSQITCDEKLFITVFIYHKSFYISDLNNMSECMELINKYIINYNIYHNVITMYFNINDSDSSTYDKFFYIFLLNLTMLVIILS